MNSKVVCCSNCISQITVNNELEYNVYSISKIIIDKSLSINHTFCFDEFEERNNYYRTSERCFKCNSPMSECYLFSIIKNMIQLENPTTPVYVPQRDQNIILINDAYSNTTDYCIERFVDEYRLIGWMSTICVQCIRNQDTNIRGLYNVHFRLLDRYLIDPKHICCVCNCLLINTFIIQKNKLLN
jgi:hypothetical protein